MDTTASVPGNTVCVHVRVHVCVRVCCRYHLNCAYIRIKTRFLGLTVQFSCLEGQNMDKIEEESSYSDLGKDSELLEENGYTSSQLLKQGGQSDEADSSSNNQGVPALVDETDQSHPIEDDHPLELERDNSEVNENQAEKEDDKAIEVSCCIA